MTSTGETAVLLTTPPGTGAIAVVRLTGPEADAILRTVFDPVSSNAACSTSSIEDLFKPNRVRYGQFHINGEIIDDVLVARCTRNEHAVYDICAHGGIRIIERILQGLSSSGAKLVSGAAATSLAWPCENLVEFEAHELGQRASTERSVLFLGWQRKNMVQALKDHSARRDDDAPQIRTVLQRMRDRYTYAKTLVEGATVALVGPPNSGKSTLFNLLVGREATMVSPRAGTTRDWVSAKIEVDGIPITLVDTAGEHANTEALERQAIDAGIQRSSDAQLSLLVVDGSVLPAVKAGNVQNFSKNDPAYLPVINKLDLATTDLDSTLYGEFTADPIFISAKTGQGIADLKSAIVAGLGLREWVDYQPSAFTDRQYAILHGVLQQDASSSQELKVAIKRLLFGS